MLLKRFSSASSTIWVIEGLSVEYRLCRQPRRRKPSRHCRSDAVVKPHRERCIRKFCENHYTVDQLLGITHPATSEYTYGMHDLSTGVNYSTHVLADRQFICVTKYTAYG